MFVERTNAEVLAYIEQRKRADALFDFALSDLVGVLPFAVAQPFLKEGTLESEWKPDGRDEQAVRAAIREYLPFAFEKCNDERGLSAMRSIQHLEAWVWLLHDDEALAFLQDDKHYPMYGRPMLEYIQGKYGA